MTAYQIQLLGDTGSVKAMEIQRPIAVCKTCILPEKLKKATRR
jgi:hypothetical protein